MARHPLRKTFWTLAVFPFLLAGCAYRVAITYLKPRAPTLHEAALSNVYMIVERPDISGAKTVSKLGLLAEADLPMELDIDLFASRVAVSLRDRGGRLSAYRIKAEGEAADTFAPELQPTSLLWVTLEAPILGETRETEQTSEKVDGQTIEKDVHYWRTQGSLRVRARMFTWPEDGTIGSGEKKFEHSERYAEEGGDALRSRYQEVTEAMIKAASDWTVKAVVPIDIVKRYRKLYCVDKDTQSAAAMKAGDAQKWAAAVPVWKTRLAADPQSWRDAWNLGAWAEKQRDYQAARTYYQLAQAASASDKDAPKPEVWNEVKQDLEQPLSMSVKEPDHSDAWFNRRIAVLPFSDMTTSMDGPVNVRRLAREALAANGYNALPLEEVDTVLRDNGFTQGGQLGAATPEQLASWLKADLLLYGDLEKFDEFMLGIIGWKRINGTFKIWSTAKKDYFWVSEKSVSRASLTTAKSGKELGWSFLLQLASSWADKASQKPMSQESAYFVNEQLLGLPRRPRKQ